MTKSKGEYGYVTLAVSSRVYSNFVAISQGNVSVKIICMCVIFCSTMQFCVVQNDVNNHYLITDNVSFFFCFRFENISNTFFRAKLRSRSAPGLVRYPHCRFYVSLAGVRVYTKTPRECASYRRLMCRAKSP